MINQKELRVGNYILDDENIIAKVEKIESTDFNEWSGSGDPPVIFSINGDFRESEVINPIPLTEELLGQCGFEPSYFENGEQSQYFRRDGPHGEEFWFNKDMTLLWWDVEIKYLHQLQNMFFAIRGKELEVKL